MTVIELLHEANTTLTPQERKELAKLLIDSLDVPNAISTDAMEREHWGKSLNRMMEEIGEIELLYPEIEDSVEWVKHLRAQQRQHRLKQTETLDHP